MYRKQFTIHHVWCNRVFLHAWLRGIQDKFLYLECFLWIQGKQIYQDKRNLKNAILSWKSWSQVKSIILYIKYGLFKKKTKK